MNFYKLIKIAQIWNVQRNGEAEQEIVNIYELSYKIQRLNTANYNIMETRKQNILMNLENELRTSVHNIKPILINIFSKWLNQHALLDDNKWATERTNSTMNNPDYDLEDMDYDIKMDYIETSLYDVLREFKKYDGNMHVMIKMLSNNQQENPHDSSITKFVEQFKREMKEQLIAEIDNQDAEQNIELYDNYDFYEIYDNFHGNYNNEHFIEFVKEKIEYINYKKLIFEIYEFCVFPLWRDYWLRLGIDQTRAVVERNFQLYSKTKPEKVISHTCPTYFLEDIGMDIRHTDATQHALNRMFEIHQPLVWVFGHFHNKNFKGKLGRTNYYCLDELETLKI